MTIEILQSSCASFMAESRNARFYARAARPCNPRQLFLKEKLDKRILFCTGRLEYSNRHVPFYGEGFMAIQKMSAFSENAGKCVILKFRGLGTKAKNRRD